MKLDKLTLAQIRAEKARRSLREFIRQAWHVVEPATDYVSGWHLDAVAEHLEAVSRGEIRKLVINIPPRHMKSLAVSVFWPCWEWIKRPELRWMFASYAASLSIRDSIKCRRLIESPWWKANWGDRFVLTSDQNAKARFENDKSGYRLAVSVGGAATGEGGDRIVCDDPHNIEEAESDAMRKSTIEWWDLVMSTRLNDPKTGARVIVMQRCHEQDLSGHVLSQGGWEHLCLPAEYEGNTRATSIGWSDPRKEPGDLLWPERFGWPEIDELKRSLGSYAAAGQLQQRPSPAEGGILKRHWWRYYTEADLPQRMDVIIQSWDLAFTATTQSAYVVGQVWSAAGADRFLLDQCRAKLTFPETIRAFRNLTARWPQSQAKLIEAKANGPALIASLCHEIPGIIPIEPDGSKEARAHAVSWQIEAGNVWLPHPSIAPWVEGFIEEAAAFPNGRYADQVDSMTQALSRLAAIEEQSLLVYLDWRTGQLTLEEPEMYQISAY